MATAQAHIDRALRLDDQLNSGESGTAQESADGLIALNAMIGSWLANRDMGIVSLTTFATLATDQTLPNGYDDAIVQNLAIRLAPEYKFTVSEIQLSLAASTLAFIRRAAAPAITGTAQKLVTRALRLIGQIGPDEISTVTESNYVFDALNQMLGRWRNSSLMCYAMQEQSIALAATNSTRSIGPTGSLVTTRPVEIEAAYALVSDVSYPIEIWSAERFASIVLKAQTSAWPRVLWYQPSMPDGVINLWPVPDAASTLRVITRVPVLNFAALTDVLALPPGWDEAIANNLAVAIAPEFSKKVNPDVRSMALETLKALKRTNNVTPVMSFDATLLRPANYSIFYR